jgi:transposase InsO family protein
MRVFGIAGLRLRRKVRTTVAEPSHQKVPDLLQRDFTAPAPAQRYVGDIACRWPTAASCIWRPC